MSPITLKNHVKINCTDCILTVNKGRKWNNGSVTSLAHRQEKWIWDTIQFPAPYEITTTCNPAVLWKDAGSYPTQLLLPYPNGTLSYISSMNLYLCCSTHDCVPPEDQLSELNIPCLSYDGEGMAGMALMPWKPASSDTSQWILLTTCR